MKDISIIIVNYNVKEFVLNLISSIEKSSKNLAVEVIIVDNASSDGSVELIRNRFPNVKLIVNSENIGFGKANNQGIEIAKGKFILFLNPDTVLKEDTLHKMVDFLNSNPKIGMATCKVLNPDGSLQLACRRSYPTPWVSFTKIAGLSKIFPKSKIFAQYNLTYLPENATYEVDAISGSFMFLKREILDKVKGFDSDFFMYGEDLDLCYRVRENGYKIFYFYETEIIHYKGESTKRSNIDETRVFYNAMSLFVEKHFSSSFLVKIILKVAIQIKESLAFLSKNRIAILPALLDFSLFALMLFIAENYYKKNTTWVGFPNEIKPWIFLIPAFFQVILSFFVGVYKSTSLSVSRTILALFIGLILISSSTFFLKQYAFSRAVVLITYSLTFFVYAVYRIILKIFFHVGNKSHFSRKRALLVGSENELSIFIEKLKKNYLFKDEVIGLISKNMDEIGKVIFDKTILGTFENINKVIQSHKIGKVIFLSKEIDFTQIFNVVGSAKSSEIEFMIAGDELDYLVGKSTVTILDEISFHKLNYNISQDYHQITKRILDVTISLPILVLIFPFVFLKKIFGSKGFFSEIIMEIPSVFFGKKSLVGPRKQDLTEELYLGKVGLFGLWFTENVHQEDSEEINKLNLFYAKNQNIWLDLDILGKSVLKIFYGENNG